MTNLEKLRRGAGLSRAELSKKCGVPLRTIEYYEQQNLRANGMSIVYGVKLADALGASVSDLIDHSIDEEGAE